METRHRRAGRPRVGGSAWRWLSLGLALALAMVLWPLVGDGHIIREEPWHPVPGSYLRALFELKLQPVDWQGIEREFDTVTESGFALDSVWEGIEPARSVEGIDHVEAIRGAIEKRDPQALYLTSTRAVSQLVRHHLARAAERLDTPGEALERVLDAQRIFRAFDRFIAAADPEAHRHLGLAWLRATTAVGSAGVADRGRVAAGPERFAAARAEIVGYLETNYETEGYAARGPAAERTYAAFDPYPATAVTAGSVPELYWLPPAADINDQDPLPRLVLNFEERGIDERDLFLVAYGDMLFDSPEIFGDPARAHGIACATCHNRSDINQRFFIPGVSPHPGAADVDGHYFNPRFNDRRDDPLDIPSLRGLRFTAPYGRDGRFASLRDFTRNVIVNEFAGDEPTPLMLDALVAYLLEFDFLPAPWLEPDGSLVAEAPAAARRGEEIFHTRFEGMGNRSCATCHVPSSNFLDGRPHDIGSGAPASERARDSFFDTPTLLGIAHTAPYMHDGSLATLRDVVDWFDERFDLALGEDAKSDLTAYLEHVGTGQDPYEIFDEENTQFRLFWEELSTFLSTLDTLIPARDRQHAVLLLDTVAPDLRADASALQDLSQAPEVYALADRLDRIREAIVGDDWDRAAELWESYKEKEAELDAVLR